MSKEETMKKVCIGCKKKKSLGFCWVNLGNKSVEINGICSDCQKSVSTWGKKKLIKFLDENNL